MTDFTSLDVWKNAHKLALEVYKLTSNLPKEELFGLTYQIRGASVSVASNIAEREARYSSKDKWNFLVQARSSIAEVKAQLLLIHDLYKKLEPETDKIINNYESLGKQLNSLINYRRKISNDKS